MKILRAKAKVAKWENIPSKKLLLNSENRMAYFFLFEKNNEYFKIGIDKKTSDFYEMSDTITTTDIEKYLVFQTV